MIEQKFDLTLMPSPTHEIKSGSLYILQWGWIGFEIKEQDLENLKNNFNRVKSWLMKNAHGVYFILLEDLESNKAAFWVDCFSCKKIFYLQKKSNLVFSDFLYKLKPLLNYKKELNYSSLALYLMHGYIPLNETLYRSVKTLKPYCYYFFNGEKLDEVVYYSVNFKSSDIEYGDCIKEIIPLLEQRFIELTKDSNEFFLPLSGGKDSRLLLALTLKHYSKDRLKTFTFGQKGTYDYEIGKGLARKYGLDSILLAFSHKNYYRKYVILGTKYKGGLLNHSINAPSKIFEEVLAKDNSKLIISGLAGVMFTAGSGTYNNKKILFDSDGFMYPEHKYFNYNEIKKVFFPQFEDGIKSAINEILKEMKEYDLNFETNKWYFYAFLPYFTNICVFAEAINYKFALPLVDIIFFDFIQKIPEDFKKRHTFFHDIVMTDPFIYTFYRYPLKNNRGMGYGNSKLLNIKDKTILAFKSIKNQGHPMKNYINFERIYSDDFLDSEINYLRDYDILKPFLENLSKLSFREKTLLLSLKLYLELLF